MLDIVSASDLDPKRLKEALEILDDGPLWSPAMLAVLEWAAAYYHHPIGDVFAAALPALLRQPRPQPSLCAKTFCLIDSQLQANVARSTPSQDALVKLLREQGGQASTAVLDQGFPRWHAPMRALLRSGVAKAIGNRDKWPATTAGRVSTTLTRAQQIAVTTVSRALDAFQPFLLRGVTGSGKTEVYMQIIDTVVRKGRQALVLVPEISLTTQTVARFEGCFGGAVVTMHSALNPTERARAFLRARNGDAAVVIGTRSAVWTPLKDPGLIVVDEEHDDSYKQRDGFRYCARDVAVMRGRHEGVPVILGSATPSLESIANARAGRYQELTLPSRPGAATLPMMQILDLRNRILHGGLCEPLLESIDAVVARREQALVFLNRRGYAPVLMCHGCGAPSMCRRCDARMTYHREGEHLVCHHCGAVRPVPRRCSQCRGGELFLLGLGTQRLAEVLKQRFGAASVVRIDRDATRRKGELAAALEAARAGTASILVGTQMLAKGHDFPGVTLVAVTDADAQLYSVDLRATERLAQLIVQVAGRAGRRDRPGRVIIQTHHPQHPLFTRLVREGYARLCEELLDERRAAGMPPYSFLALFHAEAAGAAAPLQFLNEARTRAAARAARGVEVFGPVPATMARRAGRHRAQLWLRARRRAPLHELLDALIPQLRELRSARYVRWSLDVDPRQL